MHAYMSNFSPAEPVTADKKSLLLDFKAALPYIDLLKKKKGGVAFGPVRSSIKPS